MTVRANGVTADELHKVVEEKRERLEVLRLAQAKAYRRERALQVLCCLAVVVANADYLWSGGDRAWRSGVLLLLSVIAVMSTRPRR